MKGAKRSKNLEVEVKTSCYYEVIMSLLKDCHANVNGIVHVNGHDILIVGIEKGIENTEKPVH